MAVLHPSQQFDTIITPQVRQKLLQPYLCTQYCQTNPQQPKAIGVDRFRTIRRVRPVDFIHTPPHVFLGTADWQTHDFSAYTLMDGRVHMCPHHIAYHWVKDMLYIIVTADVFKPLSLAQLCAI
jgi:hypothetical protein